MTLPRIPRPRELWDHLKAKIRGEIKVAPYGCRGRVYQPANRKAHHNEGNIFSAKAKPKATISARIIRANGDIEDLGVLTKADISVIPTDQKEG